MGKSVQERFVALSKFYDSHTTRDIRYRLDSLRMLHKAIETHAGEIADALRQDLGKSADESYLTETGIVLSEIRYQMKHLRRWSRPRKVSTPAALFPSRSRIISEPKGVVLIIAPWNYPFQLAMDPLVGAIAAGNCVALKPSTTSSATCRVIGKIVSSVFPEPYVSVFDGGHDQTAELLRCRFDHIFFTGGSVFGRTVAVEAAKNLVPATLELGGKSPCIVDSDADVDVAAHRIVWGKFVNAGQTCIAPDYLFVHAGVRDRLIASMQQAVLQFYGDDPKLSPIYPRIVSDKAFDRLSGYLDGPGSIIYGGDRDRDIRYMGPTFMCDIPDDSPAMTEEIFGPILPIKTFEHIETVVSYITRREKPLAFYYFGKKRTGLRVLSQTTSGGACINDTLVHVVNPALPFGGVGMSGMGRYHGRYSFETFSNLRSTVISGTSIDIPLRYPPYKMMWLIKRLL